LDHNHLTGSHEGRVVWGTCKCWAGEDIHNAGETTTPRETANHSPSLPGGRGADPTKQPGPRVVLEAEEGPSNGAAGSGHCGPHHRGSI